MIRSLEGALPALGATLQAHAHHAGPAIALVSFGSGLAMIGIFVPTTTALLAAGGAVALGQWSPTTALWGMAGLIAGSLLSYEAGRRSPDRWADAAASKAPRLFAAGRRIIERHGAASVILSRFIGPPATVPYLAGCLGMRRPTFIGAVSVASLWVPGVMTIGYLAAARLLG
jgi:membrane protein DedA with SNARE-associated domain